METGTAANQTAHPADLQCRHCSHTEDYHIRPADVTDERGKLKEGIAD